MFHPKSDVLTLKQKIIKNFYYFMLLNSMNCNFAKIKKPISVSSNYYYAFILNNLHKKEEEEIVTCYHFISICDDVCNVERVFTRGMKQGINPSLVWKRKKWNHFSLLIETKVILLSIFLLCLRA